VAPPPVLFVLGGSSMYIGAAVAVLLFDQLSPSAVAWLRMLGAALVMAGAGIVLIADVQLAGSPTGFVLALVAAAFWAAYIVLGKRVATRGNGLDDITVGLVVTAVLLSPLAVGDRPGPGIADVAAARAGSPAAGDGGASRTHGPTEIVSVTLRGRNVQGACGHCGATTVDEAVS